MREANNAHKNASLTNDGVSHQLFQFSRMSAPQCSKRGDQFGHVINRSTPERCFEECFNNCLPATLSRIYVFKIQL